MFGSEYFTVGGYITELGAVLCRTCGEARRLPVDDSRSVAEMDSGFWDTGAFCDDCHTTIVEGGGDDR